MFCYEKVITFLGLDKIAFWKYRVLCFKYGNYLITYKVFFLNRSFIYKYKIKVVSFQNIIVLYFTLSKTNILNITYTKNNKSLKTLY